MALDRKIMPSHFILVILLVISCNVFKTLNFTLGILFYEMCFAACCSFLLFADISKSFYKCLAESSD